MGYKSIKVIGQEATFDNGFVSLYHGDCRDILSRLPANAVHCVVTSPP